LGLYIIVDTARGLAYLDKHKGFAIFALKCADMHAMCALAHTFAEVHFPVKEQGINGLSRMAWFLLEYW
jgi:hypothetical protein